MPLGTVLGGQTGHIDDTNLLYSWMDQVIHADDPAFSSYQDAVDYAADRAWELGVSQVSRWQAPIYFGPGVHDITEPIRVYSVIRPAIICSPNAQFKPSVDVDSIFHFSGCTDIMFSGGEIRVGAGRVIQAGIRVDTDPDFTNFVTSGTTIQFVQIAVENGGYFVNGIHAGTGVQAGITQNDEALIQHCNIHGLLGSTQRGIYLDGGWHNMLDWSIRDCFVADAIYGYDVDKVNSVLLSGCRADGSAPGEGVTGSIAFRLQSMNISVNSSRVEAYDRLAVMHSNGNGNGMVTLKNVEFSGQEMKSGDFITHSWAGMLDLQGINVLQPAYTPRIVSTTSGELWMSGTVQINGVPGVRPTAANLVSGANVRGSLRYLQGDETFAYISGEIIDFEAL